MWTLSVLLMLVIATPVICVAVIVASLLGIPDEPGRIFAKAPRIWGWLMVKAAGVRVVVHHPEREQTVEEALKSNQATYKPQGIFSAGPVQLLEELDDGRLLIQVDNDVRLQLAEEKQTLPFSIWSCEELLDDVLDEAGELALQQSQAKILTRLLAITHDNEQAQEMLQSDYWQAMPAQEFSFAAAGLLGMTPETSQMLLEMTNAQARLDTVLEMINAIGSSLS